VLLIALIYALYMAVVLPLVAIGTCVACAAGIPVTYLAVLTRVLVSRPAWVPDPRLLPLRPLQPGCGRRCPHCEDRVRPLPDDLGL
jgi:hypothetical protein